MSRQQKGAGTRVGSSAKFLATIYRLWVLRYVDVPEAAVKALRQEAESIKSAGKESAANAKYIPVVATVNGRRVRTTLLPAGGGRYRMQFNTELRKAAQADGGDAVSVELSLDRASREIPVPPDLRAALEQHPKARRAFEQAPPGLRRQILKWMDCVKSESARAKRIDVVIDRMTERAILKPASHKG
jgi:Bacteriocin-protection, YdeI or OmpD-Associated/Domain of unknown function (DUF1905)